MRTIAIRVQRLALRLDPPFFAAWDSVPRRLFPAAVVRVATDIGLVGIGSGDMMAGFDDYVDLFVGGNPLAIAGYARTLETISFHGGRYWPLEGARCGTCSGRYAASHWPGCSAGSRSLCPRTRRGPR